MSSIRSVLIRPEALEEAEEARAWYEARMEGLGERFVEAVSDAIDQAVAAPEAGRSYSRGVRRVLVRRFPFAVFYRLRPEALVVIAIFHGARDPHALTRRMRSPV
ncbi:MAG TPA: type II toxin-antitoxin system RelE/ParE family toxin [Polyangia bacterium]